MNTHERMTRIFQHKEADRVPIIDGMWGSTIERWHKEGLPKDVRLNQHFGLDNFFLIPMDTSPRFPAEVVEETDDYIIERTSWGMLKKNFKPIKSTPLNIEATVKDRESWSQAKEQMTPTPDRIDWNLLEKNYGNWRKEGGWILSVPWFGSDVVSTSMCGSEVVLMGMADDPEWVADMFNHGCDLSLALLDMVWEKGYTFDELAWFDDMAYGKGMLFSKDMWRELVRPYQIRVIEWAHQHGIKAHLHCCGKIDALIPDLIDIGLDMLDPLEVKAGMDPAAVKKAYGKDLALKGGFDVRNWNDFDKAREEISQLLPIMMESGGYVFSSDHSIPETVSYDNYRKIVEFVKEVGSYE